MNTLKGLGVAMVTPFKKDLTVDVDALKALTTHLVENGADYLVVMGTTGETPVLDKEDKKLLLDTILATNAGRKPVVLGMGGNNTHELCLQLDRMDTTGISAILSVSPYYNKPTQRGFYEHFKAIALEVGIPHCVYNIPGRSAKNIEPDTIAKLAELENITMVKEATGSLDQCSQILNSTNLTVLSGDDSLTLPMMSVGAEGVISVAGNIVPTDLLAMVRAALSGDFVGAAKLHHKLFPLCRDMLYLATNPIPVKSAMQLLGRDTGELRLPMTSLEPKELEALKSTLIRYGILAK